jgi:hypothetical protein
LWNGPGSFAHVDGPNGSITRRNRPLRPLSRVVLGAVVKQIFIHPRRCPSSRARAFEPSATPSLVVHERPSREGSSRRHVGGHVRDQRRARARSMRVEIRAKCANNLYQRTFQSISPSVHELAFEDVSRVDINQRRRCDVHGVHLVLTPGARARAWWDFLFFMKRRFDDKILH